MQWNWLHLSDLHHGMRCHSWLWPRMEQRFLADITALYERSGPWDFVLFTGDLTQQGTDAGFRDVDSLLARVWAHLATLGPAPALLAVPGNHDLVRPPVTTASDTLRKWAADRRVPIEFWENPHSAERQVVANAMWNYSTWWRQCPQRPRQVHEGMLPGDFSFTAEKDGARLGIVGLNSTFLQLADDDYRGQLALHPAQFHGACPGGNGVAWLQTHDLALLLTHQPPDWLMPDAQAHLRGEIAESGQFAAHLFGHMHELRYTSLSEGGSEARHHWQSASLFGLENYTAGALQMSRVHGYCAGRLQVIDNKWAQLTFWPRKAHPRQDGTLALGPDTSCKLQSPGDNTVPAWVPLLRPGVLTPPPATHGETAGVSNAVASRGINVDLSDGSARDVNIRALNERVKLTGRKMQFRDINITKRN